MANINAVNNVDNTKTYSINSSKAVGAGQTEFSSYLGESENLDNIFDEAAAKYNVPVELLKAVGKAESNFNTSAVSRCGAQGIMQLMPATARGLGVTNSFDPRQNIMGGAKYLSGLLKKYDGNFSLTLAAYNAGSGNVAKYGGIPPFEETQNYVKKILGFIQKAGSDTDSTITGTDTDGVNQSNESDQILHLAPVTKPTPIASNYAFLLAGNAGNTVIDLNTLFTYDDYMKFLDIYLKDKDNEDNKDSTTDNNKKDISYNPAVLNLLSGQN